MIEDCRLKIEYLRSASFRAESFALRYGIGLEAGGSIKKTYQKNDGATRGASACTARATSINLQYSIVNLQF